MINQLGGAERMKQMLSSHDCHIIVQRVLYCRPTIGGCTAALEINMEFNCTIQ